MNSEKVFYTDGLAVKVTESALQVKKKWYTLSGITKHGFTIMQPERLPWGIVLVLGVALLTSGILHLIPQTWVGDVYLVDVMVTANQLAMVLGGFITLVSLGIMLTMGERYAVSITTSEGEQNVVVSRSKDYITSIVHGLNEAFFMRINPDVRGKSTQEYRVSGR